MNSEKPGTTHKITEGEIYRIALRRRPLKYRPTSVYRLQINSDFSFRDAIPILPNLNDLGFDTVYLSPIFENAPESSHGYYVTNPHKIDSSLGSLEDLNDFSKRLNLLGMGLILDIVPNHMYIATHQNKLWFDVLENGPSSPFAHFFDIDWSPVKQELKDKVLLPILPDQYGVVLENKELTLVFSEGAFFVEYQQGKLPIAPDTYPEILEYGIDQLKSQLKPDTRDFLEYLSIIASLKKLPSRSERQPEKILERSREKVIAKERLKALVSRSKPLREFITHRVHLFNGIRGNPGSFDLLDKLLNLQSYRLAFWRVTSEEINYRRFFDIHDLAAIRNENPEVFEYYHRLVFKLLEEDKIQGLRVDHPDGLYDPVAYFQALQRNYLFRLIREDLVQQYGPLTSEAEKELWNVLSHEHLERAHPLYIVVEKILDRQENLPEDWAICGTVGYDFLNACNGLFVDPQNEMAITEIYEKFIGEKKNFSHLLYEKKKFFAAFNMASELNTLSHRLNLISEKIRRCRDFTLGTLTTAIREVIACFPVYRTYIRPQDPLVSERDQKFINIAITQALKKHPTLSRKLFDFLRQVLLGHFDEAFSEEERKLFREFVLRFQQLTAPIMAKGAEDTVFYIYNRLISLNEVGGDPTHFGFSTDEFHKQNQYRIEKWPYSFIATSTHDTKRSEDVRMRLDVLSEIPQEWETKILNWNKLNEKHKSIVTGEIFPDKNTEYFIYQTLLGAWPNEPLSAPELLVFRERLWNYFLKAIREAKTYTNWLNPREEHEEAVKKFIVSVLSELEGHEFQEDFFRFKKKISGYGFLNALSSLVLKSCSPGISEFFQGSGIWDYSLTDPDNRRPVDFKFLRTVLEEVKRAVSSHRSLEDAAQELFLQKEDGRIKTFILWRALNFRKAHRRLFLEGSYTPLTLEGEYARHGVAFMRKLEDEVVIVLVGRFFAELLKSQEVSALKPQTWGETYLILPEEVKDKRWVDCITGKDTRSQLKKNRSCLHLVEILNPLSVAILTPKTEIETGNSNFRKESRL